MIKELVQSLQVNPTSDAIGATWVETTTNIHMAQFWGLARLGQFIAYTG